MQHDRARNRDLPARVSPQHGCLRRAPWDLKRPRPHRGPSRARRRAVSAAVDLERARTLFGDDALGWIVDRLQTRLERGQRLDARLRLDEPTKRQREALLRLLGRRPTTARSISVDPAELAAVLARAGIAPDLRTLIEALRGPVADRRAAAAAEQARWDGAFRRLRERAAAIDPR